MCGLRAVCASLEITFQFVSSVLCDTRTYIDKEEWKRRLESLISSEIELISMICENDKQVPTLQLSLSSGVLSWKVFHEVWQRPGALPVVRRTSEESLLPHLGTWKSVEAMVSRIWLAIEGHMERNLLKNIKSHFTNVNFLKNIKIHLTNTFKCDLP